MHSGTRIFTGTKPRAPAERSCSDEDAGGKAWRRDTKAPGCRAFGVNLRGVDALVVVGSAVAPSEL
jgi:hypothetical protein